jgi:hypothetical protein
MISDVIAWKFNSQPGMRCKEIDGVMAIVEFPGGIPSQADQDLWTSEYGEYKRKIDITDKANAHVLAKYSELKQRKLLSTATALQDKQIQGITLTAEEEATLQMIRDANAWITLVRDMENAAIADGVTLAENLVFPE